MASFDEFHDLVKKESPETIANFYEQFFTNKVAAIRTIIKMAEEKGFTFSVEEVQNYVRTMNENDEFADIELAETALMSFLEVVGQVSAAPSVLADKSILCLLR